MAVILIVEDNVSIAKIWSVKLKQEGYEVVLARTGREGLEKVKEHKPSLILMDIMIPGLDGVEVFQQLKQNVEYAGIPVVFLSSSIKDRHEIQKILDMGAEDFIPKFEISPADLAVKVKEVLSKRN
jgi:two-component system alkaline phosphatase synthesis response regulator PhoP